MTNQEEVQRIKQCIFCRCFLTDKIRWDKIRTVCQLWQRILQQVAVHQPHITTTNAHFGVQWSKKQALVYRDLIRWVMLHHIFDKWASAWGRYRLQCLTSTVRGSGGVVWVHLFWVITSIWWNIPNLMGGWQKPQPCSQNEKLAFYVSANHRYVHFVRFRRIISTFSQYVSYWVQITWIWAEYFNWHFPSVFVATEAGTLSRIMIFS